MTNLARSKRIRRRRWVLVALIVVLLGGSASYFWLDAKRASAASLHDAASGERIAPIGQVHLIAAMDRGVAPDAYPAAPGQDPASIPDTRIQVDVAVKLEEMGLPVEPLDIRVEDRLVTLDGRVEDTLLRDAIEVTVRSVPGVRQVHNRIEVVGGE